MTTTKMAFKYRAYPTRSQERYIDECIHSCWWFYRYVLHQYEDDYKQAKANYQKEVLSYYDLNVAYHPFWFRREPGKVKIPKEFYPLGAPICHRGKGIFSTRQLLKVLRRDQPQFRKISSDVMEDVLDRVNGAFNKFWKNNSGYPHYPKEKDYCSITWIDGRTGKIKLFENDNLLKLSKISAPIKIKYHRPIKGKIKRANVLKDILGRYYVSLVCEFDDVKQKNVNEESIIGIDMNIKAIDESLRSFITLSTGEKIDVPRWYTQYEEKLIKIRRMISETKFGSNKWKKYNRLLKHIYDNIKNKRNYWLHNLTRKLENKYDYIIIEDMDLTKFYRKRDNPEEATDMELANDRSHRKAWNETPFGNFKRYLGYKMGNKLIAVNPAYTSKTCNHCKNINYNLKREKEWKCQICGNILDRDINAAKNIRDAGIIILKNTKTHDN